MRNGYHIQEGGRRSTYPLLVRAGSNESWQLGTLLRFRNWIENTSKRLTSIHWRARLASAAAVILAPMAYTKVAAIKNLVVGSQVWAHRPSLGGYSVVLSHPTLPGCSARRAPH